MLSQTSTLAQHKLKVSVQVLISCVVPSAQFSFDADNLLICSNQHFCRSAVLMSESNFKQQSVVNVEELKSVHISCNSTVHYNFPGVLARLRHHVVLNFKITLLLSALAIAPNEIVSIALTSRTVFKSCKPEVFGTLFVELSPHGRIWELNHLVIVVGWA